MQLSWIKCHGDTWCSLRNVDLGHAHFDQMEGVYIIWHMGNPAQTVRVGQGVIRDRLQAHRNDPKVQAYAYLGLSVTWAEVTGPYRDGVEAYLASQLNPLVGERFPARLPIAVNMPW